MRRRPTGRGITSLTLVAAVLFSGAAGAVDVIPGNAVAPRPDRNAVMVTALNLKTGKAYVDGRKQTADTKVTTNALLVRYVRTFAIQEHSAAFYVQPSFSEVEPSGILRRNEKATGIGDTSLAFAYWPYADKTNGRYLAVAGYAVLPTGKYDSRKLANNSANRYSGALQIGYHTRIVEHLDAMLVGDVQWYGDNGDYRLTHQHLEQDAMVSGQATLMFKPVNGVMLAASYFIQRGGATRLDGATNTGDVNAQRYQFALRADIGPGNLILQYGGDLKRANGARETHRALMRYIYAW